MVTTRQFQQIAKIKDAGHNPNTEEILIVGVLNNLSEKEVRELPIDNYRELKRLSHIELTPPNEVVKEFIHNGVKYNVELRFKYAGQFIDFSNLHTNIIENLHLIMALFAYEGEDYRVNARDRAEQFLDIDFQISQSVAFFFSKLMKELSNGIETYSLVQEADGTKRSGVGRRHWTTYLTGTEQNGNSLSKWIARNLLDT